MMGEIYIRHRMLAKTIGLLMVSGWLSVSPITAAAQSCEVTLEGNDAIRFSLKHISVDAACKDFTVHLKHVGKLPKLAMGHNWVLTETRHHRDMGLAGGRMKLADDYLPRNDARVIAHTPVIGGGQSTEVVFPTSRLRKGGAYTFFCSFPGHWNMMKGTLVFG